MADVVAQRLVIRDAGVDKISAVASRCGKRVRLDLADSISATRAGPRMRDEWCPLIP